MDFHFSYDRQKKYVIGVSGGPDSMALLSLLKKEDYQLIVCFVNYHTRKESNQEETMVCDWCQKNRLPFCKRDAFYSGKGNFESWARKARYSFFKEVYEENCCEGLFIAHHKDDLIETYLLQKKRKNIVKQYGFNEKTEIMNMIVYRPLLSFEKKELEEYCIHNNIPFSIDSTNLENVHERNKIRHDVVEKMTADEKDCLALKIKEENLRVEKGNQKIQPLLAKEKIPVAEFSLLEEEEKQRFLYSFVVSSCDSLKEKMSWTRIHELEKIITGNKPNATIPLDSAHSFVRCYDYFCILQNKKPNSFVYKMEFPGVLDTPEFSCDFRGDTSFLKITENSYPLTFRNAKHDDIVTFGKITKKISRIFIDEKVPKKKRESYPVVEDCNGRVIYIPLYRSDIQKNIAYKLKFMIK